MHIPVPLPRLAQALGFAPLPSAFRFHSARWLAHLATAAPALLFLLALWQHRNLSLSELFAGSRLLSLGGLAALSVAAIWWRPLWLARIDRRFFREPYEPQRAITGIVERMRSAASPGELAAELRASLDRFLHVSEVTLLLEEEQRASFVDPLERVPSLDASSVLLGLVSAGLQPLPVGSREDPSPSALLPNQDRRWLASGGFELLVPVVAADGRLTALVALGSKRSRLAYERPDLEVLRACAQAIALILEARRFHDPQPLHMPYAIGYSPPATECLSCKRVFFPHTRRCRACESPTEEASLPCLVAGRFRVEERIGCGGMGIVYRALDLALERQVAVKTLTRLRAGAALRLRREARVLAAVSHPNLATIYGLLDWRGTPLLILELLRGGVLTDRLADGPIPPASALVLGIHLAEGLESLHRRGILHRDIKPSNIAFGTDGTPKLLDFGLARFLGDRRSESWEETRTSGSSSLRWSGDWRDLTASHQLVGTLQYLSPEAVDGAHPDPIQDLWALCVVLWETVTGHQAFDEPQLLDVVAKIRSAELPALHELDPGLPEAVADFFAFALHRDPDRRPPTASHLSRLMAETHRRLVETSRSSAGK